MKTFFISTLVVGLSLLTNLVSASSFKNIDPIVKQSQVDQKLNEKKDKKQTKYDFSLFKFISPSSVQEKDSTIEKIEKSVESLKDATVYENPRSFFKFS